MSFDQKSYQHGWYITNREVIAAKTKAWRDAHLEDCRLAEKLYARARRARKRSWHDLEEAGSD